MTNLEKLKVELEKAQTKYNNALHASNMRKKRFANDSWVKIEVFEHDEEDNLVSGDNPCVAYVSCDSFKILNAYADDYANLPVSELENNIRFDWRVAKIKLTKITGEEALEILGK